MDQSAHCEVVLVEPERMNLLGLLLGSVITRRLDEAGARWHARCLRGQVLVEAGEMRVSLGFTQAKIQIRRGRSPGPRAAFIRGTLTALLDAAQGRRRVLHVLRGELVAWGWPTTLWHMLSLLRTTAPR
jgi:hypothetical protein